MAHDVFISYPTPDSNTAKIICDKLESNGLDCWIAPRDIPAGTVWADTIYDAVDNTVLFVFIYSAATDRAPTQLNELQLASNKGKQIILLRIDDTPLSKEVEFSTSRFHWFDASNPPIGNHLSELTQQIQRLLQREYQISKDVPNKIATLGTQAKPQGRLALSQYGGTAIIRTAYIDSSVLFNRLNRYFCESLFERDLAVDQEIWPFTTIFTPPEYSKGLLAESWELTDPTTIAVHLRKGVHWHNKPPIMGREFTALDVQSHFDRMIATANSQSNLPYSHPLTLLNKVMAIDRYTIVFSFKKSALFGFIQLAGYGINTLIEAPEASYVVDRRVDWRKAIGTGPFVLSDYVPGSSLTLVKNPDYWGYDQLQPRNRLPYLDKVIILDIPDISTALAALRTGKLDILANVTLEQARAVANTNPEIVQSFLPASGFSIELRCDRPPFNDVRVRKALQLSIDRPAIARGYYGNAVDGLPAGLIHPIFRGWCIPYVQWPEELQREYSYNPTLAKQLLAEAGYPSGFVVNCVAPSHIDLEFLQIVSTYFSRIGIDMEIRVMELAVFSSLVGAGKQDHMILTNSTGRTTSPFGNLYMRQSGSRTNHTHCTDPKYDALITEIENGASIEDIERTAAAADIYAIKQHWAINICPTSVPILWQPYLNGYNGELDPGAFDFARCWIDHEMKKSLGR